MENHLQISSAGSQLKFVFVCLLVLIVIVSCRYNITNWLEKNKDPMNDTVAELFGKSDVKLLAAIFKAEDADAGGGGGGGKGKKKKGGSAQTISGNHKVT